MSYKRTGTWAIQKRLQYVEEADYAVTPTSSPSLVSAGKIRNFSFNMNGAIERYRSQGSRVIADALQTGQMYTFEIEYNPIDINLLGYGINDPNGTGTIDKSLSFIYSKLIDGVENFIFLKGCVTDQISIEVTPKGVSVTQSFLCREITTPVTTADGGLTTPTWATNPTTKPWVGKDSGSNPLTHNSINYDTDRFALEVSWSLDPGQPNGEVLIKFLDPTNKDVNLDFDYWQKDTVLFADTKAATARALTYILHATAAQLTFVDVVGETYDISEDADANETTKESFAGFATNVSIAAV